MNTVKLKIVVISLVSILISCQEMDSRIKSHKQPLSKYVEDEQNAIDTLKSHGLYNYLDSAYLYTYIYFGGSTLKRCGAANIDSVLPVLSKRKVICQDLILQKVRFVNDSSFVFLTLTPLVNDSILSCNMVEGPQLPHEVMFNYKTKRFVQFVYDENSFLRVNATPLENYNEYLKKTIENEKLEPHPKFKSLLSKIEA